MIEFLTNTAAYLSSQWQDASSPEAILTSLSVAQGDIVIIQQANGGTAATGAVTTSASSPAVVNNGNNVFSVPLTATDFNFVGRATVTISPAGAIPITWEIDVVAGSVRTPARILAIETDTNELQADWANDGRLDNLLDDVPTTAELNARTLPTADYATSTALAVVDGVVDGIALVLSGITSLANWLRLLARKDEAAAADLATELDEINTDTGTGTGNYDPATDSLESIGGRVGASTSITVSGTNPTVDGELFVVSEDDYLETDGRSFDFTSEEWPDLTGATVTFRCKKNGRTTSSASYFNQPASSATKTYAEVVLDLHDVGGAEQTVRLELSKIDSDLEPGSYFFHVRAVLANESQISLVRAPTGMTVAPIVEDEDPE